MSADDVLATVRQPEERLDRLAQRLYGSAQGGTVEALLKANQRLAEAAYVQGGTPIVSPEIAEKDDLSAIRPWD